MSEQQKLQEILQRINKHQNVSLEDIQWAYRRAVYKNDIPVINTLNTYVIKTRKYFSDIKSYIVNLINELLRIMKLSDKTDLEYKNEVVGALLTISKSDNSLKKTLERIQDYVEDHIHSFEPYNIPDPDDPFDDIYVEWKFILADRSQLELLKYALYYTYASYTGDNYLMEELVYMREYDIIRFIYSNPKVRRRTSFYPVIEHKGILIPFLFEYIDEDIKWYSDPKRLDHICQALQENYKSRQYEGVRAVLSNHKFRNILKKYGGSECKQLLSLVIPTERLVTAVKYNPDNPLLQSRLTHTQFCNQLYNEYGLKQLRNAAKKLGVTGYSKMNKAELCNALFSFVEDF